MPRSTTVFNRCRVFYSHDEATMYSQYATVAGCTSVVGLEQFAEGNRHLDGVDEADELRMALALHAAVNDGAIEHVEGSEQDGGSVTLTIMHNGSVISGLERQTGLATAGAWICDAAWTDNTMARAGGHIEADNVLHFSAKAGSLKRLKVRTRCG